MGNGSVKTAQLTAGCSVRTPANVVSSPSMAQSSTHMVLRAIELDWSLLDPTPLYRGGPFPKTATSGSVGPSAECLCGNGCMSMDGGFQAVRAAAENLQIRPLLKNKYVFYSVNSGTF